QSVFIDRSIMSASSRIPSIALPWVSERAKKTLDLVCYPFLIVAYMWNRNSPPFVPFSKDFPPLGCLRRQKLISPTPPVSQVEEFLEKDCIPAEARYHAQLGQGKSRLPTSPAIIEDLKPTARHPGRCNALLP